jgi:arginine/lysine/ornithine decarboxylase
VNGLRRTKDDYIQQQISTVFTSNTFESLLVSAEQLRTKLLQLGCFREVMVIIDKAQGYIKNKNFLFIHISFI